MPFTAAELANISNAVEEYRIRGKADSQIKQDRPLYDALQANKKTFPGGNEYITGPVKGEYTSAMIGYTHDDEQQYVNPANIKRWRAKWYETGAGISCTLTELKIAGISVVDSLDSRKTVQHSDSELVTLTNLLEEKLDDLEEGSRRSLAEMDWRDGSQDAKAYPGIFSIISETPTVGIRFGIDSATNTWWRNLTNLNVDTSTLSNLNLVTSLQGKFRQARRYNTPKHRFFAGSDYLGAFEGELRSKGTFTQEGWASKKQIDASVADVAFKGVPLEYDPLLDDLGKSKYGYLIDMNSICKYVMEGEDMKHHTPARPPEKYVLYRARTFTGCIVAKRLNTSIVSSIL